MRMYGIWAGAVSNGRPYRNRTWLENEHQKDADRDHWPKVSCAIMAGGSMTTGQVHAATNRWGEFAGQRPVHFQEVIETLYNNLGVDSGSKPIVDQAGRPQPLVENGIIRELV